MKIKIILTGGTIGSEKHNNIVSKGVTEDIITLWQSKNKDNNNVEFVRVTPFYALSENISISDWERLIDELSRDYSNFDGIIITHGSDTLSYTSALVSIYCSKYKIPVVLTGADKVLSDSTSNGYDNFDKAIEIVRKREPGVFTVFNKTFAANRIMEADYYSDTFISGNQPFKHMNIEPGTKITFKNRVKIIKEYPFADYSNLAIEKDVKAVLIIGYHSGTANEKSVKDLYEKCKNHGAELYLQGLNTHSAVYSSAKEMEEKGVHLIYNDTPEYAFARLMFTVNGC